MSVDDPSTVVETGVEYEHRIARIHDPGAVVEVLNDEDIVRMFRAATSPKSVSTLADECDIPISTAYRKVGTLREIGLFREHRPDDSTGPRPAEYERRVGGVTVTLRNDVTVEYLPSGSA